MSDSGMTSTSDIVITSDDSVPPRHNPLLLRIASGGKNDTTSIDYHCRSAMICRDDLELRWRLHMCENEFSHISLLLYISTAF